MNYHLRLFSLAVFCMILTFAGCAYITIYPQPTKSFIQKPYYQVSYDKAWDTVLEVLGEERVGAVYQNKEKRRLVTGFFTNASAGSNVQQQSRWSYTITLTQLSENKTQIEIICKIEQYLKDWGWVAYKWRDITDVSGYKNIAHNLEKWLYEKIEKRFDEINIVSREEIKPILNLDYSQNLVRGKTTKQDVEKDLGQPTKIENIGEYEYWAYYYKKPISNSSLSVPYRLTLKYDKNGFLFDYVYKELK